MNGNATGFGLLDYFRVGTAAFWGGDPAIQAELAKDPRGISPAEAISAPIFNAMAAITGTTPSQSRAGAREALYQASAPFGRGLEGVNKLMDEFAKDPTRPAVEVKDVVKFVAVAALVTAGVVAAVVGLAAVRR